MDAPQPRTDGSLIRSQMAIRPAITVPSLPYEELSPIDSSRSFERFTQIVLTQRWKILAFMSGAMILAIAIQFTIPKVYEASTLVKVDRHSAMGVVGQEASQVSSVDDMDQILTTQMELAQSDPVVRPVAEKYDLLRVEKQLNGLTPEEVEKKKAAPIELKKLKITRPPNSYLIRISYRARDPQLAAAVANGIANSLSEHANDTWNRSYTELSTLVVKDMESLRTKMESSTKMLAKYEQELGMVDPLQRATILSSRYSQLNTEFTSAQEERLRREAVLSSISGSTGLAAAQAADGAAQSSLLSEAIQHVNAARQQFASVRAYYGENHPEYKKAKKQVEEVETELAELRGNAKDRAGAEFRQALERENRLKHMVEKTKVEVNNTNAKALQYEQLRSEADNDRKLYEDLANRTRVADLNKQFQNATVQVAAEALPPQEHIFPKLLINLPVALVLSGLLGVLGAVLSNAVDTTFSDPEDVASQLNIDILATIPATKRLPQACGPPNLLEAAGSSRRSELLGSYFSEAIRTLRTAVSLLIMERPVRSILMTSATPMEGKSTTATYLAVACAHVGKRILLIDADMRRPTLHKKFNVSNETGLSDMLNGLTLLRNAVKKLDQPGLYLLPAGPQTPNPADLISMRFSAILEAASREFDLVIVDAPPMLGVSETQELASFVDSVILVTRANVTSGKVVSETLACLARARANVIGLVMNQVKLAHTSYDNYSYYSTKSMEELENSQN
jgi:polysaccharide biosynthesis transport protein